jgi:hypothetical protein
VHKKYKQENPGNTSKIVKKKVKEEAKSEEDDSATAAIMQMFDLE